MNAMKKTTEHKSFEQLLNEINSDPISRRDILLGIILFYLVKKIVSLGGIFVLSLLFYVPWVLLCIFLFEAPVLSTLLIFLVTHFITFKFFIQPNYEKELKEIHMEAELMHEALVRRWKTKDFSK